MVKNVAVVGLDDLNGKHLFEDLRDADDIDFHAALDRDETVIHDANYPFEERLDLARRRIAGIPDGVDGIITYWDFPSTSLTPFLAREFGLRYASPECVTKCEHKLWSREEEAQVIDTPGFSSFRPFDDDPLAEIDLEFPFWVKPVVGHSSMLGFEITNETEFASALQEIRSHIKELTRPFRYVIANVDLPEELAAQGATLCIAEEIISRGEQFTLEGFAQDGDVTIYGAIDSVRSGNEHTFSRYQYPSRLPAKVIGRAEDLTKRVIRQFGYDQCPFNVEFFYDAESDRLSLLEINPRISQSHSEIFLKVDGQPNQQVAVDVALGREPRWQRGAGEFAIAAKFFLRKSENARVTKVPDEDVYRRLHREVPDARVILAIAPGMELAQLTEQESYSYEIGDVFIGGSDEQELLEKFEKCRDILRFEFEPVEGRRVRNSA